MKVEVKKGGSTEVVQKGNKTLYFIKDNNSVVVWSLEMGLGMLFRKKHVAGGVVF